MLEREYCPTRKSGGVRSDHPCGERVFKPPVLLSHVGVIGDKIQRRPANMALSSMPRGDAHDAGDECRAAAITASLLESPYTAIVRVAVDTP